MTLCWILACWKVGYIRFPIAFCSLAMYYSNTVGVLWLMDFTTILVYFLICFIFWVYLVSFIPKPLCSNHFSVILPITFLLFLVRLRFVRVSLVSGPRNPNTHILFRTITLWKGRNSHIHPTTMNYIVLLLLFNRHIFNNPQWLICH